ncbi:MAG: hypothetical protein JW940_31450 [Polyangiaceae bacterium]|nr:hypothetical protein [Polyangiaceae bacterium]
MARKKTWTEKLADAKAKTPEPHRFYCEKSKQYLVIPTVQEVEEHMRGVKKGRLTTMQAMSDQLRLRYDADLCCPMTTGIFAWIVAHAADEQERAGAKRVLPWWRTLKTGGELNPKYPGHGEAQWKRLQAEGHCVVRKGKKLVVANYERALARRPVTAKRTNAPVGMSRVKTPHQAGIVRRVLSRDDFGLCVLLPKTAWNKLPSKGAAQVGVNGRSQRVVVRTERCNCQGDGWHQHRFLSFQRGARIDEGERVRISL